MKKLRSSKKQSPEVVDPRANLDGFSVPQVVRDLELSIGDSGPFYARVERNERIRRCQWEGKDPSGRKKSKANKKAMPWENAADHEVHLAQEVLLQLVSQRAAAMLRGALSVTPMEGTDARAASQMKLVMRYFLETAMGVERLVHGVRWASWAKRYGHAVLYVGWKVVKAMERREVKLSEVTRHVMGLMLAKLQVAAEDLALTPEQSEQLQAEAESAVRGASENELAAWLLQMFPQLRERGKEAEAEAKRAAASLRNDASEDPVGYFFASFVKENRPEWEALRQGIDFFSPPETMYENTFDDARYLARIRWLSAQQIHEAAAIHGWDQEWKAHVLKTCKGKSRMFTSRTAKTPWALSGVGVGWATSMRAETERELYQVVEYYDRRVTADGVQCLYKTVLHADVPNMVAKRELLEDWHGHYPFVAATSEMDEPLLMDNRGVPEIVASAQTAVKTQWDSRDDAAALTTMPPWTGPESLQGIPIHPGAFIPEWNNGTVKAWTLPKPDGRSIEIENTLRTSVNRYFGLIGKDVPEPLTMLLTQTGVDWFLASYSRAIALTAQLVQQRMSPLLGARITGTEIVFSSTREDVRGNFDFNVKFDVRALDINWTKEILGFVKDMVVPLDNREIIDHRPIIEMGMNMVDPTLADRSVRSDDAAARGAIADEDHALSTIFSGGVPTFVVGMDHMARAKRMQEDLQGSPVRQQMMQQLPQIAAVWQNRLQMHLMQVEQEHNKVVGIQGASDPLNQSPMARLKAGGWQAMIGQGQAAAVA